MALTGLFCFGGGILGMLAGALLSALEIQTSLFKAGFIAMFVGVGLVVQATMLRPKAPSHPQVQ